MSSKSIPIRFPAKTWEDLSEVSTSYGMSSAQLVRLGVGAVLDLEKKGQLPKAIKVFAKQLNKGGK